MSTYQTDAMRREYQVKAWKKIFFAILGVFLLTCGSALVLALRATSSNALALVPAIAFFAGGAYTFLWGLRGRLVIDGSRIEIRSAFQEKSADLSEIEGYRTFSSRNGNYYRLYLKDGRGSILLSRDFDTDEDFNRWFRQIPNLDEHDREVVLDEIARDEALGATREERMEALATAKTLSIFILIVTIAAALVLDFAGAEFRMPAGVVVAVAPMVILFLAFRSPLLYAALRQKADPRAEVAFVLAAAGFGLLIRAGGTHFVSVEPLAWIVGLIALACVGALWGTMRGTVQIPGRVLGLLLFAGLYGYGLTVMLDTLPDRSPASSFSTTVVGKHISSGRSTSYILHLGPWGPITGTNSISVPAKVYRDTEIGDEVCLALHAGALHAPWYRQVPCGQDVSPDLVK